MKIAIVGYGRMGKEIDRIAQERNHEVVARIDVGDKITGDALHGAECCIEFSGPESAVANIHRIASLKRNIVVGATGWYDRLDEVTSVAKSSDIGILYAPNFSIGVNLFFRIVREAAHLLNGYEEYDAAIHEIHHKNKADSPSGTALMLGSIILDELKRKKKILSTAPQGAIQPDQLHISSSRTGSFPGIHEVVFDSPLDTIELRHTMKNRAALAFGAVLAAEWLAGRKGVFTFNDVLTT